ncbi:hypothetical protein QU487_06490 [Crenobacter sp. SG2305]|uniref:hypothetical protein n=1 Tax=Crenobacter oryzisoli TaxID=3056844 RepID=UPI0025AA5741|nr:hypothetical protein [Crenobacter sp. SG2305]MDN0082401.1 hypothetical protein [Crenobacter sp. SG2305]
MEQWHCADISTDLEEQQNRNWSMLSWLFGRKRSLSVPQGFLSYGPSDFERFLKVSPEESARIANDYLRLVQFDVNDSFTAEVIDSGRNLHRLSMMLQERYSIGKGPSGSLALYLSNVASMHIQLARYRELGVTRCTWLASACGLKKNDPNAAHLLMSGQSFDPGVGLLVEGAYFLPGVAIGCTCIAKAEIPGFED